MVLMTGRFIGFVVAFAIPMVLARLFDQHDFGTYKQLFLVFGTLLGVAQFGMAESLYYFLPFETTRSGAFVFNSLLTGGGLGVVSMLVITAFRNEIAGMLNNPDLVALLPWIGLYLVFQLMSVTMEIVMTVRKQHVAASATYAITDIARAIFFLLPVLLFPTMGWLMVGALAYAITRWSATMIYVIREFRATLRPDAPSLRKHLTYAIPFGVAGLIEIMQLNYHLYAVSWYFDTATFAIYAVGCLQIPLMDFLMASTCNVMMVNMRERIMAGDNASVVAIWLDSVRKLGLLFAPLVAVLLVCADYLIVLLFTSTYERSIPIFMVWTISMLLMTLLTDGVLRVYAETRFLILQNLIRLGVIIVLIQWFLGHFDLIGAILVTLVATAVTKVVALYRIRTVMDVSLQQLLPWKSLGMTLVIAAAATLPALLVRATLDFPGIIMLMLTGGVYTLTYYLLLQYFGPMQDDEKQMLSRWVQLPFIRISRVFRLQSASE